MGKGSINSRGQAFNLGSLTVMESKREDIEVGNAPSGRCRPRSHSEVEDTRVGNAPSGRCRPGSRYRILEEDSGDEHAPGPADPENESVKEIREKGEEEEEEEECEWSPVTPKGFLKKISRKKCAHEMCASSCASQGPQEESARRNLRGIGGEVHRPGTLRQIKVGSVSGLEDVEEWASLGMAVDSGASATAIG